MPHLREAAALLVPVSGQRGSAASLAPNELEYRWRLMELYLNGSRADKFLAELKFLSEQLPDDKETRDLYQFYKKEYDFGS